MAVSGRVWSCTDAGYDSPVLPEVKLRLIWASYFRHQSGERSRYWRVLLGERGLPASIDERLMVAERVRDMTALGIAGMQVERARERDWLRVLAAGLGLPEDQAREVAMADPMAGSR